MVTLKEKKSQKRIEFGKVYHDKVFNLFYFNTYEPRATRKEKSRNYYIHVTFT